LPKLDIVVFEQCPCFFLHTDVCVQCLVFCRELGYRAYRLESVDDLNNPFVSMYFGAAYVAWLSEYEGRYV